MSARTRLTGRQQLFVEEYLKDLNATQASIRAGYSAKRALDRGSDLLKMPLVAEAVAKAMEKRSKRIQLDADKILRRVDDIAESGERDADKLKANELLGKHLKLWVDKVEVRHEFSLEELLLGKQTER